MLNITPLIEIVGEVFTNLSVRLLKKLNITKNSKILDIGCACGGLGEVLQKKYGIKDYTGIEINKKSL